MPSLVNLGSLCIDHVYAVPGLAGPGETVSSSGYQVFPGGKGLNQSLAAAQAGADVRHVGRVGADGLWLREALSQAGVDVAGVQEAPGPSGHAVIQVDPAGQNAIVIAGGANRCLDAGDLERALSGMGPGDWLLLQNEINDLEGVLAAAEAAGAQVAFNVAPVDGRERGYDLSGVSLLIVNEIEAAALSGERDPDDALEALCAALPDAGVALTLGSDGLRYGRGHDRLTLSAYRVQAVDETAAGDAFIGYLMAALLEGRPIADALGLASAAGALAVTRPGAASSIPSRAEVLSLWGG